MEISFDYSNVKTGDISLNKIIQNEFDTIGKYFNTLFESKPNSYVYKKIKKMPKSNLKCENKEEYKYKKNDISTSTSLLILPSFTIKQKTNNNNNPTLNKCLHYRSKVVVITIDVEFKSEKNIKNEIITNFRNLNYQWTFIRFILSTLGFNNKSFSKKNIVNNVLHRDQNLLKKYDFYKSFQKFAFLSKNEITISKDKEKFKDFWPSPPKFYDIMKSIVPSKKTMASITEMTLDIMKEIG